MNNPPNPIANPEKTIEGFSKGAKGIEYWAKKASHEIVTGSILGYFYITITLILLSIFAVLSVGFIIWVGHFFPEQHQWLVSIIAALPLVAVVYFFSRSLK